MKKFVASLVAALLLLPVPFTVSSCGGQQDTVKIGILLPLKGERPFAWEDLLDWEVEELNKGLEDTGFQIELQYENTFGADVEDLASDMTSDDDIQVVIGPETSSETLQIAKKFAESGKLLLSPSATSDELFRAFSGGFYFARTCQSDVAQARIILGILARQRIKSVALIYENTTYGRSFADWSGFFASEMGLTFEGSFAFTPGQEDLSKVVGGATSGSPEYVVAAAFPEDAANIRRQMLAVNTTSHLLLTDAGTQPALIDSLGEESEGITGVAPAPSPASGFPDVYRKAFGTDPPAFAAETYDALVLAACVMARQRAKNATGDAGRSFREVVVAGGDKETGCSIESEVASIREILEGGLPGICGATGTLQYDRHYGVDPLVTYYWNWVVEEQDFKELQTLSSRQDTPVGSLEKGAPSATTKASRARMGYEAQKGTADAAARPRSDQRAVILSTAGGLAEYRHQADALSVYQLLRRNGVPDDHIILMMADDIKDDAGNTRRGDVRNAPDGKNLRAGAVVDYSGEAVTPENFTKVMLGAEPPGPALDSGPGTDLLVYISGDCSGGKLLFDGDGSLDAGQLSDLTVRMFEGARCRRVFYVTEVDEGTALCSKITTPGALCMTCSDRGESSIPVNYDSRLDVWLTDRFTFAMVETLTRDVDISLADLYQEVYLKVGGAHVRLLNYWNFGNLLAIPASDFFAP